MTFSFNEFGNMGRLANQMFQYATIMALAEKNNTTFIVPPESTYGLTSGQAGKSKISEAFDIDIPEGYSKFPTYKEPFFHFDANLFNAPHTQDINISGYFQTEKYFKHIKPQVKKTFTFKKPYQDAAKQMRDMVEGEVISLHIRRGDYVGNSAHHSLGIPYYEEALSKLPSECMVIIFTDDPKWAMSQEAFAGDRFLVSETDNAYTDMCLMTMCDYHIIANSSFSWWGAWLSDSKKVIAPKSWFEGVLKDNKLDDIYCEGWEVQ